MFGRTTACLWSIWVPKGHIPHWACVGVDPGCERTRLSTALSYTTLGVPPAKDVEVRADET